MVRKRKSNALTVDFSGVETLGRFHEDGDYRLRVVEVTQEEGDKYPYLNWLLESVEDPEGARVYNNTSLAPQSLWNVKAMLEAIGVEVPDSEFELDLESYADLELMGKVEMENYEGKPRPRLVDFWPAEDKPAAKKARGKTAAKEDEDEDEKPARGARGKAKPKAKVELTEDDIGEMSEDELQDVIDTNKLDVDLGDFRTLRRMQAAVVDAAQEAGLISDEAPADDEDEDERPTRRGRGKAAAKDDDEDEDEKPARTRRSRAKPAEDDEDEAPVRRSRRRR